MLPPLLRNEVLLYFIKVFHISNWVYSWMFCFFDTIVNGSVPFIAFSNCYLIIGKPFLTLILNQPSFQLSSNGPAMMFPSASLFSPTALNVSKTLISNPNCPKRNWNLPSLPKNLVLPQDSFQRSAATPTTAQARNLYAMLVLLNLSNMLTFCHHHPCSSSQN